MKNKTTYYEQKLANGVQVIAEPFDTVQSVSIGFFFKSGVLFENGDMLGSSHFIEHMLFKGTVDRTAKEIARQFDRIGGYLNAFTTKDYCCYYARVVKDILPTAIEILADMVKASVFDGSEFERERRVILEEIKMYEDSPDEIIHELLVQNLWRESPLGRPILGTSQTVGSMDRDKVYEYYQNHYGTGNLIVCAAGNLEWDQLIKHLDKHLSDMRPGKVKSRKSIPKSTCATNVYFKDIEQIHLALGATGVAFGDRKRHPITIINAAFGGGMSSRLFQGIREKRGLAYSVYSYHTSFRYTGLFGIYAGTSLENLSRVLELMHHEIRKLAKDGLTKTELEETKSQLKGNMLIALESTTNRMNRLATGFLYSVAPIPPDQSIKPFMDVSRDLIVEIASELLDEKKMAITILAPSTDIDRIVSRSPFSSRPFRSTVLGKTHSEEVS